MKTDRGAALLLMAAAIVGLLVANSPVGPALIDFKFTYFGFEELGLKLTVEHWVSDLVLAVFFLVAGLELKYELRLGILSKPATALIPVVAALGGVIVPSAIYVAFNWGTDYLAGWPIPAATDIAFALGVLAIFGRGLPKEARIFLLSLAIFDDLMAILIIAVFFTSDLQPQFLIVAALVAALHILMERQRRIPINTARVVTFLILWYLIYQSGVHATIAGVLLGIIIPASKAHGLTAKLQPWTNTLVLPLFAFFAVAIALPSFEDELSTVFLGITVGLPLGKAIGIAGAAILLNRFVAKESRLPLNGFEFLAVAFLAGVGFTVSLLISNLAFKDMPDVLADATLGVIAGSLISMALGAIIARLQGSARLEAKKAKKQEKSHS